jgi:leader peptidase (prepilin peptidase) / N-methyltransferase
VWPVEYFIVIALAFVLGAVVASFLNVVADRVPRGQSILAPPSHCPECGHRLSPAELVPVVSYLALRGRCRSCGTRIPVRLPLVEATGGALFALAVWRYGMSLDAFLAAIFFSFLLLIFIIDLEHKVILNTVLLLALPVALISAPLWSWDAREPVLGMNGRQVSLLLDSLLAGVLGLVIFLLVAGITFLIYRKEAMGFGDVKFVAVLGVWLGLYLLPVALLLAVILGGIISALMLVLRLSTRRASIAFGPFLCLGGVVGLVWGEAIGSWYLGFLTG